MSGKSHNDRTSLTKDPKRKSKQTTMKAHTPQNIEKQNNQSRFQFLRQTKKKKKKKTTISQQTGTRHTQKNAANSDIAPQRTNNTRPWGHKTFFMLSSAEDEIFSDNKYENVGIFILIRRENYMLSYVKQKRICNCW